MNKVIIAGSFFEFKSRISDGLISGLKKLQTKNFILEADNYQPDDQMNKILSSEGIILNGSVNSETSGGYFITDSKQDKENYKVVVVNSESKINSFSKAMDLILSEQRSAKIHRKTKETDIKISLTLDGTGKSKIETGLGFFDHMLEQIAKHSNINLEILVKGDLNVDEHHTVEDVGIALGTALTEALGNKVGIKRYGFFLPMDEANAKCSIDLSGRNYLNFKCSFKREKVGDFPTELTEEFFRGLSSGMKANIFLRAKGKNDHHKIEAMFKAFAKALNEACRFDERSEGILPSTKGVI